MRTPAYRTLNYERTDKNKQTNRSDCGWKIDIAPFVARIDAQLFRARKEMAIHHRSGALWGDRRSLGLADLRGGGSAGEVCPGQPKLKRSLVLRSFFHRRLLDDVVHLRLSEGVLVLEVTAADEKQGDDCNRKKNPFH
jgi:hypothetical protein